MVRKSLRPACQKLIPARIVSEIGGLGVRHTIAVCVNWPNIVVFFFRRAWSSLFKHQVRTSNAIGFVTGLADGLSNILKRRHKRWTTRRRSGATIPCPFARSCRAQPGKVRSQEARRVYRFAINHDAVRRVRFRTRGIGDAAASSLREKCAETAPYAGSGSRWTAIWRKADKME